MYRVVIDIGHYYNYSKYPEGTLGTKYCNPSAGCEPEKLIDRYPWYEYWANYCLGQALWTCLALHNLSCIHHWFIPDICEPTPDELKLTGGENYKERLRLRAKHISEFIKKEGNKHKIPAKLFISIHHDGIKYPFSSNTANFAAYYVQQTVPEKGRYDKDLADLLVACLRALPEVELPPDDKQKGDCSGEIRSTSLKYRPNYRNSEEHDYLVLKALSPPTSGSLLETLTLTNYDEEDYSIYCAVGNIAKEIRGAFNLFVFMHPEELQ